MILDQTAVSDVHAGLESEFTRGCRQLVKARLQQAQKDSRDNRDLVAARRSHIDEILDTFVEIRRARHGLIEPGTAPRLTGPSQRGAQQPESTASTSEGA